MPGLTEYEWRGEMPGRTESCTQHMYNAVPGYNVMLGKPSIKQDQIDQQMRLLVQD